MKVQGSEKFKETKHTKQVVVYVASAWILTVLLAAMHILVSIGLIPLSCERSLVTFNATCAGIILTYGGLLCTSVAMDMPISALEGVLRKTLTSVPKLSADSVVFFGTIASALVLTFTPLYGFYVSVSATRCKMSKSGYYTATLALNSLNLFLVSAMAWALLRFDDLGHLFQPKPVFNDIKMRILKNRQTPSTTQ